MNLAVVCIVCTMCLYISVHVLCIQVYIHVLSTSDSAFILHLLPVLTYAPVFYRRSLETVRDFDRNTYSFDFACCKRCFETNVSIENVEKSCNNVEPFLMKLKLFVPKTISVSNT